MNIRFTGRGFGAQCFRSARERGRRFNGRSRSIVKALIQVWCAVRLAEDEESDIVLSTGGCCSTVSRRQ
ncbi:hypothetical protein LINPERPRIM_LOCUS11239 [Linum perenne]